MAVKLIEKDTLLEPESWLGLSTDTKPTTDLAGVTLRAGSTFYALDTKVVYIFDGISTWYAM
jgi:hypothetical protein